MKVKDFPKENMEKILAAIEVLKSTGLKNPFEVCDILHVEPVITKLQVIPAMYNRDSFSVRPTIYIDTFYATHIQDYLCCHELGHILTEDKCFNMFNPRIDPISEFTANAVAIGFLGGGVRRPQINPDTSIENVNKYMGLYVSSNGKSKLLDIPLDDPFWGIID